MSKGGLIAFLRVTKFPGVPFKLKFVKLQVPTIKTVVGKIFVEILVQLTPFNVNTPAPFCTKLLIVKRVEDEKVLAEAELSKNVEVLAVSVVLLPARLHEDPLIFMVLDPKSNVLARVPTPNVNTETVWLFVANVPEFIVRLEEHEKLSCNARTLPVILVQLDLQLEF